LTVNVVRKSPRLDLEVSPERIRSSCWAALTRRQLGHDQLLHVRALNRTVLARIEARVAVQHAATEGRGTSKTLVLDAV